MGAVTKTSTASMIGKIGSSPYSRFRTYVSENKWVPNKTSGGFITLPSGDRFRVTTARSLFTAKVAPSSVETRSGFSVTGLPYLVNSSPGGYDSDAPIAPPTNQGDFTGGTGCLARLNTYPNIATMMGNEAKTKALLNIADQKAGIGEDLATFRQTVRMIENPGWGLYSLLKSMKDDQSMRRHLSKSFRQLLREGVDKKIADKYLEYIYGFKPLMSDIHGVISLMKKSGAKPLFIVGKGSSQQSAQCNPKTFSPGLTTVRVTEDATVRFKIWSRIDPNHAGLRALNQLGLLNPISLTWELVPWSFVVDWFVPIGSVLQALSAPAGLIFVDGSLSSKVKAQGSFTHNDQAYPVATVVSEVVATGNYIYEGYTRTPLSTWPLPGFWYNSDPFTGDRPLKALALAISNLRR